MTMTAVLDELDAGLSRAGELLRQPRVAIVGAGFSGLGLAFRLKRAGLEDVTIFEKADNVGGTWRDNRYPGLSCDIPSAYYSWTFAPNPDWSMTFSPGAEIQKYIEDVAEREGLRELTQFGTPITAGRWDEETSQWQLWSHERDLGSFDFVVTAAGFLHFPKRPNIKGLDSFAGKVVHTAEWDEQTDWAGKRVGVIGNGSTGTQLVASIAGDVSELHHFVRTPQWMVPMDKQPVPAEYREQLREDPELLRSQWEQLEKGQDDFGDGFTEPGPAMAAFKQMPVDYLAAAVPDPELRAKLTPDYPAGCRRLIVSSEYYPAMQQPNAHLVREGIAEVVPEGVMTEDGELHELDLLIVATGYDTHAFIRRLNLIGREEATVDEIWSDGYRTYESVALEKFPNLFMLGGPHSPFGHYSFVLSGEHQSRYVTRWITAWGRNEFEAVEPTVEAVDDFTAKQRARVALTTWGQDCVSWYQDAGGVPSLYPWSSRVFRDTMSRRVLSDFTLRR